MKKIICIFILPLLLAIITPLSFSYDALAKDGQGFDVPNALDDIHIDLAIISSYSAVYTWSSRIANHIMKHAITSLGKTASAMNFSFVGIDTQAQLDSMVTALKISLESSPPDQIVLVGSQAFMFCEDLDSWFPDIPMVLIGDQPITTTKEQFLKKESPTDEHCIKSSYLSKTFNITDQSTPVFLEEEINLILQLMPEVNHLYYIGGDEHFSTNNELALKKYVDACPRQVDFTALKSDEYTTEDLISIIQNLDPKTDAVIYSSWLSGRTKVKTPILINRKVSVLNSSSAPMFILRDNGWLNDNPFLIGGCFLDDEEYYEHIDSVIDRLLVDKVQARNIPDYTPETPIVKLNYEAIRNFGIDEKACPKSTIFNNKPLPLIVQYRQYFYIFILAALFFLVIFFLVLYRSTSKMLKVSSYYENLINNAPVGYSKVKLIYDKSGRITNAINIRGNIFFEQNYKDIHEKMFGGLLTKVLPSTGPKFIEELNFALREGLNSHRFTIYEDERNEYEEFFVLFNKQNDLDVFTVNITEMMNATKEIAQAKERAEKSDRMKTQFVQNMSHEIRTPLNAIVGFAQLMCLPDGYNTEEEKQQYSSYIKSNADLLTMLIDDILDLSDIDHGRYRIKLMDSSCNDICQQAMRSVEYRVPSGVALKFSTEVEDDYMLYTDPQRVQQVLINYLTNACKHTTSGFISVCCSISENPGCVTFSVTDTGTGVPADQAQNIFERFSKLDEFVQGTGLGLNICSTIAEKLHGQVKLDTSYTAGGARFVFILPIMHSR